MAEPIVIIDEDVAYVEKRSCRQLKCPSLRGTTSCTTCARSGRYGATRHNARTLRAAPQRMAAPPSRLGDDKV